MKRIITSLLTILAIATVFGFYKKVDAPTIKNNQSIEKIANETEFNQELFSKTDPNSIWVIVNKKFAINPDYQPNDLVFPDVALRTTEEDVSMQLRAETAKATELMFGGAKKEGFNLIVSSGYRSYGIQASLYDGYVARDGIKNADTYSARPGHSEHQTGLVVDITSAGDGCELEICFAQTEAGKWLASNAYKYGFILRYPENSENITGYQFEPWHFRYVGYELANEMKSRNTQTLEEFFNIAGGGYNEI